jgi:hypothetical protein
MIEMSLTESQVIDFLSKQKEPIGLFAIRDGMKISDEDFPENLNKILRSNEYRINSGLCHFGNCRDGIAIDDKPHGFERRYMLVTEVKP